MHATAKTDYALRAMVELARADEPRVLGERIARAQDIPPKYLDSILLELRHARLVTTQRGPNGGVRLARPADQITLADVIRAVDGPLANVRGTPPEDLAYPATTDALRVVWVAVGASLRAVLEGVTVDDLRRGTLPPVVRELTQQAGAWNRRSVGGAGPAPFPFPRIHPDPPSGSGNPPAR